MENNDFDNEESSSNSAGSFFENNKKWIIILIVVVIVMIIMALLNNRGSSSTGNVEFKINSDITSMTISTTYTLEVTVSNNSNPAISWESSNPEAITVDSYGGLSAIGFGTSTITAKYVDSNGQEYNDTIEIVVFEGDENVKLMTALFPNRTLLMSVGDKYDLGKDLSITPPNAKITSKEFSCDNEDILKLSEDGEVISVREGVAKITANINDKYISTINVIVSSEVDYTGLELLPETIIFSSDVYKIEKGEVKSLSYELKPNGATNHYLKWNSSDKEYVTVSNNGEITGIKEGASIITAKSIDGVEGKITVEVIANKIDVEDIVLTSSSIEMNKDKTYVLAPTVSPADASNKTLKFESTNYRVVSLSTESGVSTTLYSHEAGTAKIIITSDSGIKREVVVTVKGDNNNNGSNDTSEKFTLIKVRINKDTNEVTPAKVCNSTSENIISTRPAVITIEKDSGVKYVKYCYQNVNVRNTCIPNNQYNSPITLTPNGYLYKLRVQKYDYNNNEIVPTDSTNYIDGALEYYINTTTSNTVNCSGTTSTSVAVESIDIRNCPSTIKAGETIVLTTLISPSNATNKVITWSSSNSSVLTVSNGRVTAQSGKAGNSATITVKTNNNKTDTCRIEVVDSQTTAKITCLNPTYNGNMQQIATCSNGKMVNKRGELGSDGKEINTAKGSPDKDSSYIIYCKDNSTGIIISETCKVLKQSGQSGGTLNCPQSPTDKQYNSLSQQSGIICPSGSTASGITSAVNVGTYHQTCVANSGYSFNGSCNVEWKIVKAETTTTLNAIEYSYTSGQSAPDVKATVRSQVTNNSLTNVEIRYDYYNSNNCSGATIGTKPTAAGEYSVKATFEGTPNFEASSSSCARYAIGGSGPISGARLIKYINEFKFKKSSNRDLPYRYYFKITGPRLSSEHTNDIPINRIYFCFDNGSGCSSDFNAIITGGTKLEPCQTNAISVFGDPGSVYNQWNGTSSSTGQCKFNTNKWYYNSVGYYNGVGFNLSYFGDDDKQYILSETNAQLHFVIVAVTNNNCSGSNCVVADRSCILSKNTVEITDTNYQGSSYTCN